MVLHTMVTVTYLPLFVTILLRGMPGIWKSRHRLLFGWLVFMQALYPGRQTLAELARWTPGSITAWRFRRLLKATYGHVHLLVEWWVQEAFATLPPPQDGTVYLGGDGSVKPTRGTPHPVAQKGRQSAHPPWVGGVRCALLIATWESSRFPVAFRLLRPTTHPEYRTAKAWCRAMVSHFVPPTWAKRIMVTG